MRSNYRANEAKNVMYVYVHLFMSRHTKGRIYQCPQTSIQDDTCPISKPEVHLNQMLPILLLYQMKNTLASPEKIEKRGQNVV